VPGNAAAKKQQYNVCADRSVSFVGIVKVLAAAAGKTPEIVLYDPAKVGLKKGEGFPFRTGHFFASAEKAKRELGWAPKHDLLNDAGELVQAYSESGRLSKEVDFSVDDKILAAVGYKVPALA
jgi:nucleoside-diphosphate-sugar epimerase